MNTERQRPGMGVERDSEGEFEARFRSLLLSLVGVYAGGNKGLVFMLALELVVPTLWPLSVTCTSTDNRYLLAHFRLFWETNNGVTDLRCYGRW